MKKLIPILLIVAVALSCTHRVSKGIYTDNVTLPASEGSKDSLYMSINLEFAKGGIPSAAKEEVNKTILNRALDLYDAPESMEEAAITYRENLIDEYLNENAGDDTVTWEDFIEGEFTPCYKDWINYRLTYYSYKGGPHGLQTVTPIVFDRKTGAIVSENDLFADGYRDFVAELLRKTIAASMAAEDPELESLVSMELVSANDNFSIGADGITWYFQPYEIGPYALGVVSATVPWNELNPYLK